MSSPILQRQAQWSLGDYPVDAAFSPDGNVAIVAGGEGGLLRVDLRGGATTVERIGEHAGGALAVAWQGGGALFASSGQDGEVRLWDSRTREARVLHAAPEWSERLAFSGNGKLLAVANARRLHVFDAAGAELAMLDHAGNIAALAWRPKLNEVAALGNGGMRLHRVGTPVVTRDHPWKGACLTASWRPDGSVLASGLQDGTVHFWNVAAGTQSEMKGYGAKVVHTAWTANGKYLATSADRSIVVWEFTGRGPEGSEPLQLDAHTGRVTQLAAPAKGPYLASAARDCRLLLWRPGFATEPVDAELLGDEPALLRFTPDGRLLLAITRGGDAVAFRCG